MRKLPLLLLTLVILAGVGYFLFDALDSGNSGNSGAGMGPGGLGAEAGDQPTAALLDLDGHTLSETALAGSETEAVTREAYSVASVGTQVVAGVVDLPPGLPADEEPRVTAYLSNSKDPDIRSKEVHAEVEPGPDGRFEVELPSGAGRVWLMASGRYLYSPKATRQDLPLGEGDEPPIVRAELGFWVTGRVVLPAGATTADLGESGQSLELSPDAMSMIGMDSLMSNVRPRDLEAELDSDLAFEITGVPIGRAYQVDYLPARLTVAPTELEGKRGEHVEIQVQLDNGVEVSGVVLDDAGQPVAGAELELERDALMFGQGGVLVRDGETDELGRFVLPAVRPGSLQIHASAKGYLTVNESLVVTAGEPVEDLELRLDRGDIISGGLRWPDGLPAAGVEVKAGFDPSFLGGIEAFNAMQGAEGSAETDEQGRFTIRGLGRGPFLLGAEAVPAGTVADAAPWKVRMNAVRPGEGYELVLEAPLGVAGRVVDDLGEPMGAFRVQARSQTQGMLNGLGAETISERFESEAGEFFLKGLRPGKWLISARAIEYAGAELQEVELTAQGLDGLVLVLPRAARASGVVVDGYGNPVRGARVAPDVKLENMGSALFNGDSGSSVTDTQGRFTITDLGPGPHALVASAQDFASSEPVGIEVVSGGSESGLVLTLRMGGSILGTIYGEDGKPAAGRSVMAQNPTSLTAQLGVKSDAQGEFLFESVTPGAYQVMSFGSGAPDSGSGDDEGAQMASMLSGMKMAMVDVVEGEQAVVELGAPAEDPVLLKGRVVSDGEPVPNAMVSFLADGGAGLSAMRMASTSVDGSFEFELNEPGTYLISVQKVLGTGQQQTVEFRESVPRVEEHEVELELPQGAVRGTVRSESGVPLGNVRVSLGVDGPRATGSFTGGNYAELTTNDDGTYEIEWLRPGTYIVAAGGAAMGGLFGDSGDQVYGRQTRGGLVVSLGEALSQVDFSLRAPGRMSGRVLDLAGEPVAEAAIFLRDSGGRLVDMISMVRSDASGNFTYRGLEPGKYSASARLDTRVSHKPVAVTISADEESEAVLRVDVGTMLLITISDRDGNEIECKLSVDDSRGNEVYGMLSLGELMDAFGNGTFSSSEQRVGPLGPGSYRMYAEAADGRSDKKSVRLTGQETRRIKLRLD